MTDSLYLCKECPLAQFLMVILRYVPNTIKIEYVNDLTDVEKQNLLRFSPTKTLPLLKTGDIIITGTLPILHYILSLDEEAKNNLYSSDAKKIASCEMWIEFIIMNIAPIAAEIISQVLGRKPLNKEILDKAIMDLVAELEKINEHLKFKTFFCEHSIKIPDLLLPCVLLDVYNKALVKESRDKIPNVMRHFVFLSNLKEIKEIVGATEECKEMTILPFVPQEAKKEEPQPERKQEGKGKKDKKEGKNNNQAGENAKKEKAPKEKKEKPEKEGEQKP